MSRPPLGYGMHSSCASAPLELPVPTRAEQKRLSPSRTNTDPSSTPAHAIIQILIADDHPIARIGLETILKAEPDFAVIASLEDGSQAVEAYNRLLPDVAILDIQMPQMSGYEATQFIRARHPDACILLFTTNSDGEEVRRGRSAGVRGIVSKVEASTSIVDAVRRVAAGEVFFKNEPAAAADMSALTSRERDVLLLVVKGFTNREIGDFLACTERTAKFHTHNIFAKLGATNRAEAVSVAYELGLIGQ